MDIASKVYELLKDSVEKEGYILDEVLYEKEDGNYFLRVVIDKNGIIFWTQMADMPDPKNLALQISAVWANPNAIMIL